MYKSYDFVEKEHLLLVVHMNHIKTQQTKLTSSVLNKVRCVTLERNNIQFNVCTNVYDKNWLDATILCFYYYGNREYRHI